MPDHKPPYRIEQFQDDSGDSPFENDAVLLQFHQWDYAKLHHADVEYILGCQYETYEEPPCGQYAFDEVHRSPSAEGYHPYQPPQPIAAIVHSYEYGVSYTLIELADSTTPQGRGVLTVNPEYSEEWEAKGFDERADFVLAVLAEYRAWANGEIYTFILEERVQKPACPFCGHEPQEEWRTVESYGGVIDIDGAINTTIKDLMLAAGIKDPVEGKDYELVLHYN